MKQINRPLECDLFRIGIDAEYMLRFCLVIKRQHAFSIFASVDTYGSDLLTAIFPVNVPPPVGIAPMFCGVTPRFVRACAASVAPVPPLDTGTVPLKSESWWL